MENRRPTIENDPKVSISILSRDPERLRRLKGNGLAIELGGSVETGERTVFDVVRGQVESVEAGSLERPSRVMVERTFESTTVRATFGQDQVDFELVTVARAVQERGWQNDKA